MPDQAREPLPAPVDIPETRYAKSGDVHIAYQVGGQGPFDLVIIGGLDSYTIDGSGWQGAIFDRVAAIARVVIFDKRGTGSSDRVAGAPSLEERMDDVRAVLDAIGSRSAALFGHVDGGAMGALFAATYPERTFALVLFQAKPRFVWATDFPWAPTREEYERETQQQAQRRGSIEHARERAKGWFPGADETEIREQARWRRLSASPGAYIALRRMNMDVDVRAVLPAVHVPTLIIHRAGNVERPGDTSATDIARFLAGRIPNARTLEIESSLLPQYVAGAPEVIAFLTDAWERHRAQHQEPTRVLATVLFTDLVGSTERAVELGPRWGELLRAHNAAIRRELARFSGEEIKTAGDGFFASGFDGPARAIRCACAIRDAVGELGLGIRVGVHTGECDVVDGALEGLAVTIGARVAAEAQPGEVLVSGTVRDLVAGSGMSFEARGSRELKGLGAWPLYAVAAS
jgi:class 3 adenylate cyclase